MRRPFNLLLVLAMLLLPNDVLHARGRGGGGISRGGGLSRPAVHAPSMSRPNISRPSMPANRPNVSRPNVSRPSVPSTRPSIPSRPNIPTTRPSSPTTRPNLPSNRPNLPATRPNLPGGGSGNRPDLPNVRPGQGSRPNLPNVRPGGGNLGTGNRPNLPPVPRPGGDRPSSGDLKDFLDLPGRDPGFSRPSLPENRPNLPDKRPNLPGNRPEINLPGSGGTGINRPNLDGGDNIRNRFVGGHNVSVGDINVGIRNNNVNNIKNRWTNVNNRPFNSNFWGDPGFNRRPAYWRWQTGWGRYPGYWCWRPCAWATFGTWFTWGTWAQPVTYSYGTNVVYRDNYVYVNDQQVGTATQYYEQAEAIATSIPANVEPENVEWMPLGVYAITDPEGNDTSMMLQLAVSKEGIVAGTFYNSTTETNRPVEGMIDRESQRAAWHFADDEESSLVMEAGIYDLTKDETPALLHFDADNSQNWMLVRLPAPEEEE